MKKGITQQELATRCGISEPAIRNYELDNTTPSVEVLEEISRELDVNIGSLIGNKFLNYVHMEETVRDIVKLTDKNFIQEILNLM